MGIQQGSRSNSRRQNSSRRDKGRDEGTASRWFAERWRRSIKPVGGVVLKSLKRKSERPHERPILKRRTRRKGQQIEEISRTDSLSTNILYMPENQHVVITCERDYIMVDRIQCRAGHRSRRAHSKRGAFIGTNASLNPSPDPPFVPTLCTSRQATLRHTPLPATQ